MRALNVLAAAALLAVGCSAAFSQPAKTLSGGTVRIGVLTDFSGGYSEIAGRGALEAVKMAVEDFGGKMFGKPIDVVSADHLNKPEVGAAKAREWFDAGGVDMINDLANSGVALAVAQVAKEERNHIIVNNSSNIGITNSHCSPYAIHYAYDAYALAQGTGSEVKEAGGDSWFFVTRRLRLRAWARAAGVGAGSWRARECAGFGTPPARSQGLHTFPAAGQGVGRQDHRSGFCISRRGQRDQGSQSDRTGEGPETRRTPDADQ